jgi:hypothetical protein
MPAGKISTGTLARMMEKPYCRPLLPGAVGAQGEFAETSSIADEQHRVLITGAFNIL